MYADPSLVRSNATKLRFNDAEKALLEAAAAKHGMQLAEYARVAVMEQVVGAFDGKNFAEVGTCNATSNP